MSGAAGGGRAGERVPGRGRGGRPDAWVPAWRPRRYQHLGANGAVAGSTAARAGPNSAKAKPMPLGAGHGGGTAGTALCRTAADPWRCWLAAAVAAPSFAATF